MHRSLQHNPAVAPSGAVAPRGGCGGTVSRTRFLFVLRSQGRDGSENVWHQSVATDRGSKKGTGSLPKGFPGGNPGQMHPSMVQMPLALPFEEEFRRKLYRFRDIVSRSRILRVRKEGFRTDPTGTNQDVLHGFDPSPASPEPLLLLGTRSEDPVSGQSSWKERGHRPTRIGWVSPSQRSPNEVGSTSLGPRVRRTVGGPLVDRESTRSTNGPTRTFHPPNPSRTP